MWSAPAIRQGPSRRTRPGRLRLGQRVCPRSTTTWRPIGPSNCCGWRWRFIWGPARLAPSCRPRPPGRRRRFRGGCPISKPELLFQRRGVDLSELISKASATEAVRQTTTVSGQSSLAEADLADVFGIELDTAPAEEKLVTRTEALVPVASPRSKTRAPAAARTRPKNDTKPGSYRKTASRALGIAVVAIGRRQKLNSGSDTSSKSKPWNNV